MLVAKLCVLMIQGWMDENVEFPTFLRQTSMEDTGQSKKVVGGKKKQRPRGRPLWGAIHGVLKGSADSRGHRVGKAL